MAPPQGPVLVLLNKPFNVLSQFSPEGGKRTLADCLELPGIYPAGRLDFDSEGLLLLTNHGRLQHWLSSPRHKQPKTYLVQVEGIPDATALDALRRGVMLNDGVTLPADAERIDSPDLWVRTPPIRVRRHIPDSWIALTISEGRNRQVRRMGAAVGHPVLRLVRSAVGPWTLDGLQPGQHRVVPTRELRERLGAEAWSYITASGQEPRHRSTVPAPRIHRKPGPRASRKVRKS